MQKPLGREHAGVSKADDLLIDTDGALRRSFKAKSGTKVLLRPDGYVGWRARSADATGLLA